MRVLTFIVTLILLFLPVSVNSATLLSEDLPSLTVQNYTSENHQTQNEYEAKLAEVKETTIFHDQLFNYAVAFVVLVSIFAAIVFWNVCELSSFFRRLLMRIKDNNISNYNISKSLDAKV